MVMNPRDIFFNKLFERALKDDKIIIVSADMGAPSLDQWRDQLPKQIVNVGIAEAQMINLACGLALERMRPYCYAITPFLIGRAYDQIRVNISMMNLPVTLVGVGAGFSYHESGPTHHGVDDINLMRHLPNIQIVCPIEREHIEHEAMHGSTPSYIRLRRDNLQQFVVIGIKDGVENSWFPVSIKPIFIPDFIKESDEVTVIEEDFGGLADIIAEYVPVTRRHPKDWIYKYGEIWTG